MIKDLYEVNKGPSYNLSYDDIFTNPDENPVTEILKRVEYKYHYRPEESAVYHPVEKTAIKLRNTGALDMFTQDESGVRVDKQTQAVHYFGNDQKTHIYNQTEWLTGNSNSFAKGHRTIKTRGRTLIQSTQDMTLDTDSNLVIVVDKNKNVTIKGNANLDVHGNVNAHIKKDANVQIDGNLDAKVQRHAKIKVDGNIDMSGGNDILIKAIRDITIDAGRHLHTIWRCPDPSHYDSTKVHK